MIQEKTLLMGNGLITNEFAKRLKKNLDIENKIIEF